MHRRVEPAIFYLGTPVLLISTLNEDGSTNIAPMSSAWWLGWSCMLGLDASSKTTENLRRHGECVLNLPDAAQVGAVDRLALLTGSAAVPMHKRLLGYRSCADKFAAAGLRPQDSEQVAPQRVAECAVQLEAKVESIRPFARQDARMGVPACAIEVRIVAAHVEERLLCGSEGQRIDPDAWKPLMMSFRRFYSLGEEIHPSRLGTGPEAQYAPWQAGAPRRWLGAAYRRWAADRYGEPEDGRVADEA